MGEYNQAIIWYVPFAWFILWLDQHRRLVRNIYYFKEELVKSQRRAPGHLSSTRSHQTTRCACSWRRGLQRTRRPAPPSLTRTVASRGTDTDYLDLRQRVTTQAVAHRIREDCSLQRPDRCHHRQRDV